MPHGARALNAMQRLSFDRPRHPLPSRYLNSQRDAGALRWDAQHCVSSAMGKSALIYSAIAYPPPSHTMQWSAITVARRNMRYITQTTLLAGLPCHLIGRQCHHIGRRRSTMPQQYPSLLWPLSSCLLIDLPYINVPSHRVATRR
jgi:hypothetical protein